MTKIMISEDCGNSPKNMLVQNLTIALAAGDVKSVLRMVTDDIRWHVVGDQVMQGKEQLARALDNAEAVLELTIHHVATHGKAGAVNGTRKFRDKNTQAFCHFYEFSNAKGSSVKEITSYVIETG